MTKTILQVPLNVDLRKKAEKEALEQGFSSLQEAVRIFLTKLASKRINVTFKDTVQLTKKNAQRYEKMIGDIEMKKVQTETFTDVDSLVKHLNK